MMRSPLILALNTDDPRAMFADAETQPFCSLTVKHQRPLPPRTPPRKRRRRWLRSVLLGALFLGVLFLVLGRLYLYTLPSVSDAQARVARILCLHHGKEVNGLLTTKVGQAIIAVEDKRFVRHHGVDLVGLLRSAWSTITLQGREGGSTITEQLAKALYVPDDHTLRTKIPMMGVAIKLEQRYSKAQILDMYLNSIYFGDQQWGVVQASHAFFDKTPQALDWGEASLVAGLPQAPSSYDPTRHWALARLRQRHVLDRLVATGILSRTQADVAYQETHLRLGTLKSGQAGMNVIRRCPGSGGAGRLARGAAPPGHFIFASSWPAILPMTRTGQVL